MALHFPPEFDGCNSECRRAGKHTLNWGLCEHAVKPEPTVSMSKVYRDTDGGTSIGFDVYTVPQLAELIRKGMRTAGETPSYEELALAAAHAIVHRNDVCTRCKGSGVDPVHKACEDFGDVTREVDVPCIACDN